MNILFVTMVPLESNASATIRNKSLIRGLTKMGHKVDVITLEPQIDSIKYDNTMNDINKIINKSYYIKINPIYHKLMAKKESKKSATANKKNQMLKHVKNKTRNLIKTIYNKTTVFEAQKFNVKEVSKIKIKYNKYNIIISSSDPKSSHLIVERIFKENKDCKAKWIQYWGDPMFNDITRKSDWKDVLVKYHEKKLLSYADRIVYVSPLTLKTQKTIFKENASKMDYANQSITAIFNKTNSKKDIAVKIGYFGSYNSNIRNIMPLYNVAKEEKYSLHICGGSDLELKSTDNVIVESVLPYNDIVTREKSSDILICLCNLKGTQIPGKIYYSAGYDKPIIVVLDSEYKEYLRNHFEEFERYILCENNESSIKNAIEEAKLQLNKKDYKVSKKLTPEYMAKKVLGNF